MLPNGVSHILQYRWSIRSIRYDGGIPPSERWLFPGRNPGRPLTTRQYGRLFHQTADAAGITKPVTAPAGVMRCRFSDSIKDRGTTFPQINNCCFPRASIDETTS
jgi:hypothetical protein